MKTLSSLRNSTFTYYLKNASAFGNALFIVLALGWAFYLINEPSKCFTNPVPTFKTRSELGKILESENLRTGVELGVQRGVFSEQILSKWVSVSEFVLVDLWRVQKNYSDLANKRNQTQSEYRMDALQRMKRFAQRGTLIRVCQDFTTVCARKYRKRKFDFIYVDARHDYLGVLQDLNDWWPLLRSGGIMAGHDYVTNDDGPSRTGQNWTINFDGTVDSAGRAVKGAVDEFMTKQGLQVTVSYREAAWNTWAVRKMHS